MIVTLLFVSTYLSFGLAKLSFTCNNGIAISSSQFCDTKRDCDDGSDEIKSSSNCVGCLTDNKIGCSIEKIMENFVLTTFPCLIDRGYLCNGTVACSGLDPCDVGCPEYYRCNDHRCVKRSTVCDGDPRGGGCREEDGWQSGIGFQCVRNGEYCRIPQQLLWDGVKDCDQGEDLCYTTNANDDGSDLRLSSSTSFNRSRCFKCLDGSITVPRHKVCDGVIDCSDLSDECLCDEEVPDICRNVIDRGSTTNNLELPTSCDVGQVSCGDGRCIERSSVCDAVGDCHDNRDERFAYCRGTLLCKDGKFADQGEKCRCDASFANIMAVLCNGNDECPVPVKRGMWDDPPGFPADECQAECSYQPAFNCTNFSHGAVGPGIQAYGCLALDKNATEDNSPTPARPVVYTSAEKCDGILDCNITGADEANCPDRFACTAGRLISIPRSQVCDGIEDCDDKTDESVITCPHRFFCISRNTKVSIDPQLVCDFNINCDDNSDETNCSLNERFYCENGTPLFVTKRQMFDGRGDCSDLSDECPTTVQAINKNAFSSIYQLIANPILRSIVWIMALLALVGNGSVIAGEGRKINKILKKKNNAPLKSNLVLILNLALADFLMGVYLLMLGIAGAALDGVFCRHKLDWLTSTTCTTMGILVVLSSEASVLTMVIFTSLRLYCIIMPFKAANHPKLSSVFILLGVVWVVAFFLALLPLSGDLEYMFTEYAVLRDSPFFRNVTVSFDSAKAWASKLLTFDQNVYLSANVESAKNWKQLQEALGNSSFSEYLELSSFLGYYSANSVCIPRLFVTKKDKSWQFSLATTIFNFLAFCYVAIVYLYIVFHQRKNAFNRNLSLSKDKANKRLQALQRKVLRLVVTDFCCWVPISIMAFIHFTEGNLPSLAYVVSAIVLLPINSALNPLLYSNFIDKIFVGAKKSVTSYNFNNSHSNAQKTKRVVLLSTIKL